MPRIKYNHKVKSEYSKLAATQATSLQSVTDCGCSPGRRGLHPGDGRKRLQRPGRQGLIYNQVRDAVLDLGGAQSAMACFRGRGRGDWQGMAGGGSFVR